MPWKMRLRIIRVTQAKFTVSAAVAIVDPEGRVLLLDHRVRARSGWGLPGGFLEYGEQPDEGIRREIREETALELDDLVLQKVRVAGRHVEILFSAGGGGTPVLKADEIKGFGWFGRGELPEDLHPSQKVFIGQVLDNGFEKSRRAD